MGRPAASSENREVGLLFAKAACANGIVQASEGMVARNGPLSVFGALSVCYPTIVRDDNGGPRDGLTCMELNKTLQKNGFQRKRNRRSAALNRTSDRFGAGMYLFHMCRWRDPNNTEDRMEMQVGWANLVRFCPQFGLICSFERFCEVVDRIRIQWDPWTGRKKRVNADGTASSPPGDDVDEDENEEVETDEEDAPASTRSDSTTDTVEANTSIDLKEISRKRPHALITEDQQTANKDLPAIGSADEMEKLRQELHATKAALAMYQLSGVAAAQTPLPTPLAANNFQSAFLSVVKPEATTTTTSLPLPIVNASLPSLQPTSAAMSSNLPMLQQLLQSPAATPGTPLLFLPQMGGSPLMANAGLNGLSLPSGIASLGLPMNQLSPLAVPLAGLRS